MRRSPMRQKKSPWVSEPKQDSRAKNAESLASEKSRKSLIYGARFNDVGTHSAVGWEAA